MDLQSYGLGQNQHFDSVLQDVVSTGRIKQMDLAAALATAGIKRVAKKVHQVSDKEYQITLGRDITARQAVRMLKASDSNIYDIQYAEDIDENDLINVTDKPLWSLTKNGNTLSIQRVR